MPKNGQKTLTTPVKTSINIIDVSIRGTSRNELQIENSI